MTAATGVYRAAAWVLSRAFLDVAGVRSVYARRSVASGEAVLPWSDLDLAMVTGELPGHALDGLRRRYRLARLAFPRLGECQIYTEGELAQLAVTDPYRASLDRRCAWVALGERPAIPAVPIPAHEAARRLVFWLEAFVPTALRQRNERNLRKFALEMANALGVLEGRWPEPLTTRRETEQRVGDVGADALQACFQMAARAHALVRPPAPRLRTPLELPGLYLAPEAASIPRDGRKAFTPEALDLLLQTENPGLWRVHGEALARAGFEPPGEAAWRRAAARWTAGARLRGPGFLERGSRAAQERVRAAAAILGETAPESVPDLSESRYYREVYDGLQARALALRARIRRDTRE
jgi:hypothetical protein